MKKDRWVWMPHPAHLIVAHNCRFHLATYVGKYIVSTVGEYWPDLVVRKIHAETRGFVSTLIGDEYDREYMKKFGYEEIGHDRKYETMVFKSRHARKLCCPWRIASGENVDFVGYNDDRAAFDGHMRLCKKWSTKKGVSK